MLKHVDDLSTSGEPEGVIPPTKRRLQQKWLPVTMQLVMLFAIYCLVLEFDFLASMCKMCTYLS